MSEVVERVAQIIAPEAFEPCENGEACPFCQSSRDVARAKAREVLEALREPTEAMAWAAFDLAGDRYNPMMANQAEACWRAMIDAALKG
jgi:hypothetical protein